MMRCSSIFETRGSGTEAWGKRKVTIGCPTRVERHCRRVQSKTTVVIAGLKRTRRNIGDVNVRFLVSQASTR